MSFKKKFSKPPKPTFISHISTNGDALGKDQKVESCFYITLDDRNEMQLEPDLLPGEIVISHVDKVTQYVPYSNDNAGHVGTIFVTNYKVSFVTVLTERTTNEEKNLGRQNKLIGKDDVSLTNITDIYLVSKGRKKKLAKGSISTLSTLLVQCLELHCKDFRIQSFSFENCDRAEVSKMINTVVHHSFPSRSDLLFVFSFQLDKHLLNTELQSVPDFMTAGDWEAELSRLQATQSFNVTACNAHHALSTSLPEYFVVPISFLDSYIADYKAEAVKRAIPLWSYSYANGCALIRVAYGISSEAFKRMIQFVKESHPAKRKPVVIDLGSGQLPSLRELQLAYERLREQCMPSTNKDLWSSDMTWYSALENCQWLHYVCIAISVAENVVQNMSFEHRSVVIREKDGGTDFSPVISCLAQLMMDPASRTIHGFQCLVEREWVALGHRFADRCGIVYQSDTEESPLFLLFLDCVWQLLQQFPSSFEFSEIYLTSLWDSIGLAMFRNFLLNGQSNHSAFIALKSQHSPKPGSNLPHSSSLMSVWDWSKQFCPDDIALFTNPLYVAHEHIQEWQHQDQKFDEAYRRFMKHRTGGKSGSLSPKQTIDVRKIWKLQSSDMLALVGEKVLKPGFRAPQIKLWEHCYLRWLTPIQIVGGGMPSEFLAQSLIMEEIRALEDKLAKLEVPTQTTVDLNGQTTPGKPVRRAVNVTARIQECISSSYPFSPTRPSNLSIYPVVSPSLQYSSLMNNSSTDDLVLLDRNEY